MVISLYEEVAQKYYEYKLWLFIIYIFISAISIILEFHKEPVSKEDTLFELRVFFKLLNFGVLLYHGMKFELPQILNDGWRKYIEEDNNKVDVTHFTFQLVNTFVSCIPTYPNPKGDLGTQTEEVNNYNTWLDSVAIDCIIRYLQGLCLFFAIYKIFDFVRCNDEIRPTVQLIIETFKAIRTFTCILIGFIWLFALFFVNGAIDSPGGDDHSGNDDFPNMFYETKVFFFTADNTVGNLNYPEYGGWFEKSKQNKIAAYFMYLYIWSIYYIGMYVMLIMMLNFLIAMMGAKYEEIVANTEIFKMVQLKEMLPEAFVYKSKQITNKMEDRVGILIIFAKKEDVEVDTFECVTAEIKKYLKRMEANLIDNSEKAQIAQNAEIIKEVNNVRETVDMVNTTVATQLHLET